MRALVLVQGTTLATYTNIFAAICAKYPDVTQIRLLYVTDDTTTITNKNIRESLVELSKEHSIYEKAADSMKDSDRCALSALRDYIKEWDIVDVTAVSKEIALSVTAATVSQPKIKACHIKWLDQFRKGEEWILTAENHQYVDLLSSGDLALLRRDFFQKKHVIVAFAGIFGLLIAVVLVKLLYPALVVPSIVTNIFGLLIGVAGLYLAAVSLKHG